MLLTRPWYPRARHLLIAPVLPARGHVRMLLLKRSVRLGLIAIASPPRTRAISGRRNSVNSKIKSVPFSKRTISFVRNCIRSDCVEMVPRRTEKMQSLKRGAYLPFFSEHHINGQIRVRSLEEGWEAVLKALQTQGLPSSTVTNLSKKEDSSSTSPVIDPTLQQPPSTTFPVFVNPSPVLLSLPPPSTSSTIPQSAYQPTDEPTRHLARVATAAPPAASLQRVGSPSSLRCHPSTSTLGCCLRQSPRTLRRTSLRLRQTKMAGLRTGPGKSWHRATVLPSATPSPEQRRRLLAYLLLALVQSRKPPRPM